MEIPVVIHKDEASAYGVTVPNLPGCFSAGDTIEEALTNAKAAILQHLEVMIEENIPLDLTTPDMERLIANPDYAGGIWALVDVDLALLDGTPERINISLARSVLAKIDRYTASRHETRSGFLARAALSLISSETA